MSINKPFINLISGITKKQMIIGAVTTAVVAGGAVTGAVIYNSTKSDSSVNSGVVDTVETAFYRVVLSSGKSVSAESVYAQLKADYSNVEKLTASLADSEAGEGIVLLAEAESTDDMVVVFGDGSKIKNFIGATEFDEVIVCKSGSNKVDFDVKIVIQEEESTESESTGVSTTTSSSAMTTTVSTTTTATSTTTTTDEQSEDRDEDNDDSLVNNDVEEPQGNADNGGNGGNGQSQTTVKPSDNTPKPVETSAPKPAETEKPKPTETSAPKPTDPPAPVSQCGEGCDYFGHRFCHDNNEGYPDWYGATEKSNYKYAYNQSVALGSGNPSSWASSYVSAVSVWGADRVVIGDPTDGDGYNNVWVLKGYTDDGDEIWSCN